MTWPHPELIERLIKSQRPPSHANGFFASVPSAAPGPARDPAAADERPSSQADGRANASTCPSKSRL